ncbi:hypothetical protein AHiyo4_31780 [Arthrobacter sp. Hiyo4]|nr:hypothetical protein AHiyo4_31780 [Arthrobacter sp. Hiyo4]
MARSTDSWDESDVRIRPSKKGSRPRTKDRPSHDDAVTGRIITVDRGRYTAVVGEDSGDERIIIAARARELRRSPWLPATSSPSLETSPGTRHPGPPGPDPGPQDPAAPQRR